LTLGVIIARGRQKAGLTWSNFVFVQPACFASFLFLRPDGIPRSQVQYDVWRHDPLALGVPVRLFVCLTGGTLRRNLYCFTEAKAHSFWVLGKRRDIVFCLLVCLIWWWKWLFGWLWQINMSMNFLFCFEMIICQIKKGFFVCVIFFSLLLLVLNWPFLS